MSVFTNMKTRSLIAMLGLATLVSGNALGQENQVPAKLADGWTRVYFFAGYHVGMGWRPNLTSVNIFVNDSKVATLSENQYTVLDIKSGSYLIGCSPTEPSKNYPVAKAITFKPGGHKYFACDMDNFSEDTRAKDTVLMVPFGVLGGAVGGAIGGAIMGASDASLSDFKTKSYLDERPLPAGSQLVGYYKSNELSTSQTGQSKEIGKSNGGTTPSQGDPVSKLKELKAMRDQGLITESEYRSKKKAIIDQM